MKSSKRLPVVTWDKMIEHSPHNPINKKKSAFKAWRSVVKTEPIHVEPVAVAAVVVAAPVVSEPAPFEIKPMEKINVKGCFCLC